MRALLLTVRRKVANRPLGALSFPGRLHKAGLTKRPKRLVSYIPDLPYPVNYLSWKTDFVLFCFFIKPTVTGEMAVSSTELSRLRARRGPLGPSQKPEQCAVSDARLVRGHRYGISPLLPLVGRPQSRTLLD